MKTQTKIVFNTGRPYTEKGQLIEAIIVNEEKCEVFGSKFYEVLFYDHARKIAGRLKNVISTSTDAILASYDRGNYETISPAYYRSQCL